MKHDLEKKEFILAQISRSQFISAGKSRQELRTASHIPSTTRSREMRAKVTYSASSSPLLKVLVCQNQRVVPLTSRFVPSTSNKAVMTIPHRHAHRSSDLNSLSLRYSVKSLRVCFVSILPNLTHYHAFCWYSKNIC